MMVMDILHHIETEQRRKNRAPSGPKATMIEMMKVNVLYLEVDMNTIKTEQRNGRCFDAMQRFAI